MAPATHSTTLIRAAQNTAAIIYIPEIFRPDDGWTGTPEMARSDQTKAMIVADLASAQHEYVSRVIAIDLASGKCWDASKEIAQAVLDITAAECSSTPSWCVEFLEMHLGINKVQNAFARAA